MTGRVFNNRYEILEEIGKGGMAYVYKARCKLLNRIVAIKVLRDDLEGDSEFLKRFNTEATAAANLTHPNIVSIFDVGVHEERHYIVMEYVDGITLKQYISNNAPLDTRDALSIAYQICDALQSAHEKGIVHRDIKSHNILIDNERRVKVTDFGIARATSGSTMTATDNILGSVHYISPEQARGGYVDCKTDLYSLGVVMYEMLTGKLPFDNESPLAVAMMHCNDAPTPISDLNGKIEPGVEALVMKCLKKETGERYQKASELKTDIMKLLENPNCDLYASTHEAENEETSNETDLDRTQVLKPVTDDMLKKASQTKIAEKIVEEEVEKPSKKMFIGAIATAFAIVGLLSLFATYVFFPNAGIFKVFSSEDIKVPDLTNYSYEQAEEMISAKKLKIEIKDERESGDVDEGHIISQNPKSGRYVKKDSMVYVVVSKGAKSIRLEDYTDKEYKTAKIALEKLGFEVDKVEQNDNEVAENHIIKQKPQGGEIAEYGSLITLYVSTGIEDREVVVPRLVGETIDKAKKLIEQNELTVGDITYEKSVLDKGIVIKQSIGAGESTNVTTAIELVVSNGDEEVEGEDASNKNQKEKLLSIALPQDRDQVTLKICANGAKIHESIQQPKVNPEYSLKVKGSTVTKFEIYFDGVLHDSQTIDFSK